MKVHHARKLGYKVRDWITREEAIKLMQNDKQMFRWVLYIDTDTDEQVGMILLTPMGLIDKHL